MTSVKDKTRPIRVYVVSIALSIAFGSVSASLERPSAQDQQASSTMYSSKRMADGKQWTTHNLNVKTVGSYCFEDAEPNCRQYGRLYTWESARRGCQSLGDGWRLPADDEWRQMAKYYGGIFEDSDDRGKAAYNALLTGHRLWELNRYAAETYAIANLPARAALRPYRRGLGHRRNRRHSEVRDSIYVRDEDRECPAGAGGMD